MFATQVYCVYYEMTSCLNKYNSPDLSVPGSSLLRCTFKFGLSLIDGN